MMDDKTFIASYAAQETTRINERLKQMVNDPMPPTDEMRDAIINDVETTLSRLQNALSYLVAEVQTEDENEDDNYEQ